MNQQQEKVKKFMDHRIEELNHGLKLLNDHDKQPTSIGDLYNGMLKHTVAYETQNLESLRDQLIDILS
jgi:hypothetical protein